MEKQVTQTVEAALLELPYVCDMGSKLNSKGYKLRWIGWKAHIDWSDGGVPLNVLTTSASLHDSQVAIPMLRQTAGRAASLYDLMDSAYDAAAIYQVSRELGHVPIIAPNRRSTGKSRTGQNTGTPPPALDPAQAARFCERTTAERGNSRLKDEFGCRHLRVRGHKKAHLHIMLGSLALFADQLLKPFTG